jgi:hypothetical protein
VVDSTVVLIGFVIKFVVVVVVLVVVVDDVDLVVVLNIF